ncbi:CRISPR-associated protein Cas5h [Candidatus Kuenenia stuttgartiensis]|uniref:CRISPR-associated protein Cas5h n=1 Tax=Kuenenia stuttgartiensis TaxID=174633 RepID=A0A6G7GME5_KUEST|nr:CRISPR-associated protein Cas5 [Candidatus Kuenenia stuttgartiensis]QII10705.1 CRISPR-associated protein Cas5h [Candidatus Kuenenia stuttgartiensis]
MFGFRLWGKFGAFRDPLTITQNITLPIPPKTTVGGIMAAILGIDYNDYFKDDEFFRFKYSLVLPKHVRKKSFVQNYIEDYTSLSTNKCKTIKDVFEAKAECEKLISEKKALLEKNDLSEAERKKVVGIDKIIESEKKSMEVKVQKYNSLITNPFRKKTKPIYRELILDPEYYIFVKDFKYENKLIEYLENHFSAYNIYLGNTEFAANFENIKLEAKNKLLRKLDSFTTQPEKIIFEVGKYTNIYVATRVVGDREYRDYKKLIICDRAITLKEEIEGYSINTSQGVFNCEFV